MRNDHKKEHPRKEQNRHQLGKASYSKKTNQQLSPQDSRRADTKPGNEQEIKGMDIDLMNYTDI